MRRSRYLVCECSAASSITTSLSLLMFLLMIRNVADRSSPSKSQSVSYTDYLVFTGEILFPKPRERQKLVENVSVAANSILVSVKVQMATGIENRERCSVQFVTR